MDTGVWGWENCHQIGASSPVLNPDGPDFDKLADSSGHGFLGVAQQVSDVGVAGKRGSIGTMFCYALVVGDHRRNKFH